MSLRERYLAQNLAAALAIVWIVGLLTACNGFTYGAEDDACADLLSRGQNGSQEDMASYRRLCE